MIDLHKAIYNAKDEFNLKISHSLEDFLQWLYIEYGILATRCRRELQYSSTSRPGDSVIVWEWNVEKIEDEELATLFKLKYE